jgi:Flp pilus assembly pilin Flp
MEFRMWNFEQSARFGGVEPVRSAQGAVRGGIMWGLLERLLHQETAQDLAEYGIALATISIVAVVVAVIIAKDVGTLWSRAQNVIDSAAS